MATHYEENILTALRKITRAIDLYSHQLSRQYNLTGPQIVCLRHLRRHDNASPTEIARATHLSQATILNQVVNMTEATDLDAAPVLQAGSILDGPSQPA